MRELAELVGQTLDEKYRIERELGRGGMGTVYLATHLGTERPVAIKVISPQYMARPEFVERFRREARAAGRLRHPNVVDVTDFGFAHADGGQVAYLVMEYLDGCTLGEILEEEKNLPVAWTLDILEQVCSAVQEAHEQGIIHRDLKPDNIWLEPNQRGGYTVKVLDFGIAKLETSPDQILGGDSQEIDISVAPNSLQTVSDRSIEPTIHDSSSPTLISESSTMAAASDAGTSVIVVRPEPDRNGAEKKTAIIQPAVETDQDSIGTKLLSVDEVEGSAVPYTIKQTGFDELSEKDLTRVGAVLGTPLYMSPEQCHGLKLDARSDVYSLGVIAYQMLSGDTPFHGDFTSVMEAHKNAPPPPLKTKKVRRKLKRTIFSALEKDPNKRPQSAEAFATILRSRSEGIMGLLRRSGMIYTEHISKFLLLSAIFHIPMIIFTASVLAVSLLRAVDMLSDTLGTVLSAISAILLFIGTAFGAYLIIGTNSWIVTQSLAVPLRPIKLRNALKAARKKWKRFAGTGLLSAFLQFVVGGAVMTVAAIVLVVIFGLIFGFSGGPMIAAGVIALCLGALGFLTFNVLTTLVGPVLMMENAKGWSAIKRSAELVRRSLLTSIAAVLIMFLIPAFVAGLTSAAVNLSARAIWKEVKDTETTKEGDKTSIERSGKDGAESEPGINVSFGNSGRQIRMFEMSSDTEKKLRNAILETLLQIFLLPLQIVSTSFTAIIVALLYLKTRQAGGESLNDLLENFEVGDQPKKKWQERVRQRLIQSGRMTSKPTG